MLRVRNSAIKYQKEYYYSPFEIVNHRSSCAGGEM